MENTQKIKKLNDCAKSIIKGMVAYDEQKKRSDCDKFWMGFNKDDRFSAHKGILVRVDSWLGYYGSSSCSTVLHLDNNVFEEHFLKVLNRRFRELMEETAESIEKEAKTYKENALKELKKKLEEVERL